MTRFTWISSTKTVIHVEMFVIYSKLFELVNFSSHVLMTYISARNLHQFYETLSNFVNIFVIYSYCSYKNLKIFPKNSPCRICSFYEKCEDTGRTCLLQVDWYCTSNEIIIPEKWCINLFYINASLWVIVKFKTYWFL